MYDGNSIPNCSDMFTETWHVHRWQKGTLSQLRSIRPGMETDITVNAYHVFLLTNNSTGCLAINLHHIKETQQLKCIDALSSRKQPASWAQPRQNVRNSCPMEATSQTHQQDARRSGNSWWVLCFHLQIKFKVCRNSDCSWLLDEHCTCRRAGNTDHPPYNWAFPKSTITHQNLI